jgi:hypothetical protein
LETAEIEVRMTVGLVIFISVEWMFMYGWKDFKERGRVKWSVNKNIQTQLLYRKKKNTRFYLIVRNMFRPFGHFQVHEHNKYTKESGLIPREACVKVNVRVAF